MIIKYNQSILEELSSFRLLLDEVANYYPNFDQWWEKVCKQANTPVRHILVHYENKNNTPVGILILKETKDKSKVCTLFVAPKFRGLHIATDLLDKAIEMSKYYPIITIPLHQSYQYQGLIRKFNFDRIGEEPDKYVKGHTEVIFRIKGKRYYGV